jgi:hypothetical protein
MSYRIYFLPLWNWPHTVRIPCSNLDVPYHWFCNQIPSGPLFYPISPPFFSGSFLQGRSSICKLPLKILLLFGGTVSLQDDDNRSLLKEWIEDVRAAISGPDWIDPIHLMFKQGDYHAEMFALDLIVLLANNGIKFYCTRDNIQFSLWQRVLVSYWPQSRSLNRFCRCFGCCLHDNMEKRALQSYLSMVPP